MNFSISVQKCPNFSEWVTGNLIIKYSKNIPEMKRMVTKWIFRPFFVANYGFWVISIEIGHLGWIQGSRINHLYATGCKLNDDLRPQTSKYLDRAFLIKNCIFYQPSNYWKLFIEQDIYGQTRFLIVNRCIRRLWNRNLPFLIENRQFFDEIRWKLREIVSQLAP